MDVRLSHAADIPDNSHMGDTDESIDCRTKLIRPVRVRNGKRAGAVVWWTVERKTEEVKLAAKKVPLRQSWRHVAIQLIMFGILRYRRS